jgi:hypothetical protein
MKKATSTGRLFRCTPPPPVGASLLAKNPSAPLVIRIFAKKLAPVGLAISAQIAAENHGPDFR